MTNSLTKEKIENILKVLNDKKTDDYVSIHKKVLRELCLLSLNTMPIVKDLGNIEIEDGMDDE